MLWPLALAIAGISQVTPNATAVVKSLYPDVSEQCIVMDTISQQYFPELLFLTIDTGCYYSTNPRPGDGPMRLALDPSDRVFRLFNFDSSQFDEMTNTYPLTGIDLDPTNVYDYGRFYIEVTLNYSFWSYHYLDGVEDFIELNRSLMLDDWTVSIGSKLETYRRQIGEIKGRLNFDSTIFDRSTRTFYVDYYIWYEDSGNLRHVRLAIEYSGACSVVTDPVMAEAIGYFDPTVQ